MNYHNSSKTTIIVSLVLYYFLFGSYVIVQSLIPYKICPNTTVQFNNSSFFRQNLDNLLVWLSSNASGSIFYKASAGDEGSEHRVYGLYMCYGYITQESCKNCVNLASNNIKRDCPNASEAMRWEEECQIRFSTKDFFGELNVTENIEQHNNAHQSSEPARFAYEVKRFLSDLAEKASLDPLINKYAFGTKYSVGAKTMLFAVSQCTGDLSRDNCKKCLEVAISNVSSCCSSSVGVRILSKSCYLRYETYNFFGDSTGPSKGSKLWNNRITIIIIGSASFAIFLLGSFVYCLKAKLRANKGENDQELRLHSRSDPSGIEFNHNHFQLNEESKEIPCFDLSTLNEATRNFAESNMLGQGGFGPVYKGTLSDGREIAVKRLSSNSDQGLEEFTNEVILIMKLQHKNLVRLLGFCRNGEEKLLIYEYMPNGSLDVILFDPTKRAKLDWNSRVNIINGIARGMLYLHEDSRLRIIHRDLKASNILLDSHMNPKISDFGMARIFQETDDEASTCRLVGTYGYMAPEYAMEGHYSVKSDVFSFGVLLLEIITGKKNGSFQQSKRAPNLTAYAWQLWNEGKATELMDSLLTEVCDHDEFLKYVYIALLCVQEDANERPTMSSIVVMLNEESEALPQPERPAFSWGTSNHDYDEINVDSFSFSNINMTSVPLVN